MKSKSTKITEAQDIEAIARQAHAGEDVSEHFTGNFQAKQWVDIDFPLELLHQIDEACRSQNLTRQDWIRQVCAEKIQRFSVNKSSSAP
jgi:hypothetical protein